MIKKINTLIEERKEKFILTTSSLFTKSFILFSIMATLLLFSLFNLDGILEDLIPVNFFDLAVIVFFISVPFYILMPVIRFIFNFRKIETEEEKEIVSGFYQRYFAGIATYLLVNLLFYSSLLYRSEDYLIFYTVFGVLFHIIALKILKSEVCWFGNQKI